jgi:hypothetical protein
MALDEKRRWCVDLTPRMVAHQDLTWVRFRTANKRWRRGGMSANSRTAVSRPNKASGRDGSGPVSCDQHIQQVLCDATIDGARPIASLPNEQNGAAQRGHEARPVPEYCSAITGIYI